MAKRTKETEVKKELKELPLLFAISQTLDQSIDLSEVVQPMLQLIADHTRMLRGTITLLNRETGEINIEAAYGLSRQQQEKGRYKVGEGVTGQVVKTGRPAVVPRISEEPQFLDRTGVRKNTSKKDISFICVPIKLGQGTIGTLSADLLFEESVSIDEDMRLLSIIASMIAQAVHLRQSALEEQERLLAENLRLQEELENKFRPSNIIGNSQEMRKVYNQIAQVAESDTTVLVRGATGTGKELVAHAIHYNSKRAAKPFIKVNCAALPETVIESELFGHEKGSFSGAVSMRKGRFELADQGSIFLDEIGDLSPSLQIKLLRILQEKEFERVGGTKTIKTDVRVIAATNRNLEELMEKGEFRQDLFYRLNIFPIHIRPLKERQSDILLLANHFIERYGSSNSKQIKRISSSAIDLLIGYYWPGNVRELENSIERAVLISTDGIIHGYHLPPTIQNAETTGTTFRGSLRSKLESIEKEIIYDALKAAEGNMSKAAADLGITERIMGLRVKKFNIDLKRFRSRTLPTLM